MNEDPREEIRREMKIEAIIRKSERARIVAWIRARFDLQSLAEAIERGDHWKEK